MLRFALGRLGSAIPTLFLLVTAAFFMMRAAPGGPFDDERIMPPEIQQAMEAAYHLDKPIWQQYFIYLGNVLRGDLGPSFQYENYTVNELIAAGFPVSLTLGALAMVLALVVGCGLGIVAALRQNSAADYTVMSAAMTGISIPNCCLKSLFSSRSAAFSASNCS